MFLNHIQNIDFHLLDRRKVEYNLYSFHMSAALPGNIIYHFLPSPCMLSRKISLCLIRILTLTPYYQAQHHHRSHRFPGNASDMDSKVPAKS